VFCAVYVDADLIAVSVSLVLLVLHEAYMHWRLRKIPLLTVHAVNIAARHLWVDVVTSNRGNEVLAVQTLRNSVMASSFTASTAILLIVSTLSMTAGAEHPERLWHALNFTGSINQELIAWKILLLLIDFFVACFCFCIAVRFFGHADTW
jgi:uncharacterized membrane protein